VPGGTIVEGETRAGPPVKRWLAVPNRLILLRDCMIRMSGELIYVSMKSHGPNEDAHATVSRQRRELPRAPLAAAGEVKA
jgi:hypothetical protein